MGAFDRVLSGIPGLDDLLDYIRMGIPVFYGAFCRAGHW